MKDKVTRAEEKKSGEVVRTGRRAAFAGAEVLREEARDESEGCPGQVVSHPDGTALSGGDAHVQPQITLVAATANHCREVRE